MPELMPELMPEPPTANLPRKGQQLELVLHDAIDRRAGPTMSADEIYGRADQWLIEKLPEDRRIERKACAVQPKHLGDMFSMWSNTQPEGGVIFVGISDDGKIEGCRSESIQHINSIEDAARNYCPDAKFESRRIPVKSADSDDDFIIAFRVFWHPEKVVRTVSGDAFARSGASKRKLTHDEIREIQISKGEVNFELESVALQYPDDFDLVAIDEFVTNVHQAKGLQFRHDDTDILSQHRLGKLNAGKFIPNNACCLLFAKDPVMVFGGSKLRFLRYEGETEQTGENYNVVKDVQIEGTVPQIIVKTETLIASQLREYSTMLKDGRFHTSAEYPKFAWYEGVVNACVHRSYNLKNMNIFVKMFDDKLTVTSPGMLPPTVTPQNIFGAHNPRNPILMDALRYFGFVKCANEGTRRMREEMIKNELPEPKYSESKEGSANVTVTLYNNYKKRTRFIHKNAAIYLVPQAIYSTLSKEEKRLIDFVYAHERIDVSQAMRLLHRDWGTAKRRLLALCKKQIFLFVHKDGKHDPKAHYVLDQHRNNSN